VDAANGYTKFFVERVKRIREKFPDLTIMAGNVATPDMVQELLISGAADIVKIGIGSGSVCTTRIKAAVGYPQLSAIIECADAAHGLWGHVCADGGCRTPGDVVKAFAAGADFVMLGSMLAAHDECEGEWIEEDGQRVSMKFYGMSSRTAMDKYTGGRKD
jgi:GMP reductase